VEEEGAAMSISGFIFLGFSWGIVTALVVFCFYRIFKSPSPPEGG
jgi:hypothetical protein